MRLPRPGELNDGVPAPGLHPVLGALLDDPAGEVVEVVGVISPLSLPELVYPPGQLRAGQSEVVPLIAVLPVSLTASPVTLVVSPGSPSRPRTSPPPVRPLAPGEVQQEEEAGQQEDQSHDVLQGVTPMSSL